MKPRHVLVYGATLIAVVTLVLAGREVALRFSSHASALDLAGPGCAVATALICIAVLDWIRNLRTRDLRVTPDAADLAEDEGERRPPSIARDVDAELVQAIQRLDLLANEELGAERVLEAAMKVVAEFAHASAVRLWVTGDDGTPRLRADFADGQVALHDSLPVQPADEEALRQALEHRKALQAVEDDAASFVLPLVSAQRCLAVLRVTVPLAGVADPQDATQKLSAQLAQLARHITHAVRAPEAYDRAVVDPLTGLYSKRHFINRLTEATGVSRRYGEPLSLVLVDIDSFRMLNNTYGPATGDRVLRSIGAVVQQNIREVDSAYRYGADEIALILPDTEVDRARLCAERIRRVVRDNRPLSDEGVGIITTVSIGAAEFDEDMRGIGPLLARAEEALYAAKERGRDRVEVATGEAAEPAGDQAE